MTGTILLKMKRGVGTVRILYSVFDSVGEIVNAQVVEGRFEVGPDYPKVRTKGSIICFRPEDVGSYEEVKSVA